jgi:DNA polymerase III subunit delta'
MGNVYTIVGHEWARQLLTSSILSGRVPHALLITGPPSIGKATLAQYVAQTLNCSADNDRPCGVCLNCTKTRDHKHPDVVVWDSLDERIIIDDVRDLQQQLALTPFEGEWRVAILCDFERATPEAANAFLKTLEEPAPQVVLILTATNADDLPATIVSRCQVLSLRPIPVQQIKQALMQHQHAEEQQAELLAHISTGRIGWAIRALDPEDDVLKRREAALEDLESLFAKNRVDRLAYAFELHKRTDPLVKETLEYWLTWWHDLMRMLGGVNDHVVNIDRLPLLQQRAKLTTLREAKSMIDQLRFTSQAIDRKANKRLALEAMVLSIPR